MNFAAVCICLSVTAADPDAVVATLSGAKLEGRIVALSAAGIDVQTAAGKKSVPLRELAKVSWGPAAKPSAAPVMMETADGSMISANEITTAGDKASFTLSDGMKGECPRRALRALRFPAANSPDDAAWKAAATAGGEGDILIVRKIMKNEEDGVVQVALDPLEGAVLEVRPDSVRFDFDGDKIDVKREKLEGIVFFKPSVPKSGGGFCRILRGKTNVAAESAELGSVGLNITTRAGLKLSLPLSGTTLDFSSGNVAYLADLEPDNVETSFSFQPKAMKADFGRILGLRTNGPFGGRGMKVGKQSYGSGLTLHSRSAVVYRVPEGFRTLTAAVGLAEEAARTANVHVRVVGDQRVLFEGTFDGEKRGPENVEADLSGVKRVTISVEPNDGLDLGDIVIFGEARFVK